MTAAAVVLSQFQVITHLPPLPVAFHWNFVPGSFSCIPVWSTPNFTCSHLRAFCRLRISYFTFLSFFFWIQFFLDTQHVAFSCRYISSFSWDKLSLLWATHSLWDLNNFSREKSSEDVSSVVKSSFIVVSSSWTLTSKNWMNEWSKLEKSLFIFIIACLVDIL